MLTFVLIVMGVGARSDAAAYTALAILAVTLLKLRREPAVLHWLPLGAVGILISAWSFLSSSQSAVTSGGGWSEITEHSELESGELIWHNLQRILSLYAGSFGSGWGLSWLDTPVPTTSSVLMLLAVGSLIITAGRLREPRKGVLLPLGGIVMVLLPMYLLQQADIKVGSTVQPRYLLPLLLLMLGFAYLGRSDMQNAALFDRVQSVMLVIAVSVAAALALHAYLNRFMSGVQHEGLNLDEDAQWWLIGSQPHGMILCTVTTVAFLLMLSAALMFARTPSGRTPCRPRIIQCRRSEKLSVDHPSPVSSKSTAHPVA